MKVNFIFKVVLFNEKGQKTSFKSKVKTLISLIAKEEDMNFNEINIVFCNDEFIRDYNKNYLGHDYETDIITFHDSDETGLTEGELLISSETVRSNSKRFKVKFEEEIFRVVIHGILHLCGYNDKTSNEKVEIRKKENYYIKKIK